MSMLILTITCFSNLESSLSHLLTEADSEASGILSQNSRSGVRSGAGFGVSSRAGFCVGCYVEIVADFCTLTHVNFGVDAAMDSRSSSRVSSRVGCRVDTHEGSGMLSADILVVLTNVRDDNIIAD